MLDTGSRSGGWVYPVVAMLLVQTITSIAVYAASVVAPVAAVDYGVPATWIGGFVSIVYLSAMVSGTLTGDWMRKIGTMWVAIAAAVGSGIGVGLFGLAHPVTGVLAAVIIGTCYGPINPVSAYTLNLVSPPRWRPLLFSIKQTGVVVGGAIAGLVIPALATVFGWQWATLVIGLGAVALVVLLLPLTSRFGRTPDIGTRGGLHAIVNSVSSIVKQRKLTAMAVAGMIYSGVQVSIAAFFVVFLNKELGLSLIQAGGVFAVMQVAGIIGRLIWGAAAGNIISPAMVLFLIALISGAGIIVCALQDIESQRWLLIATAVVLGFSSFGWNGVFLSEITGAVDRESVGDVIGGVQFFFFGGVVIMPPVFGVFVEVFGFNNAYLGLGVVAILGGFVLLRAHRL